MTLREQALERVRSYLALTGISARRFGVDAVGDSKFVRRLQGGSGITLTTLEKVDEFIANNPPPCPAPSEDAA